MTAGVSGEDSRSPPGVGGRGVSDLWRRVRLPISAAVLAAVFFAVTYLPWPFASPAEHGETLEDLPGIILHWHVQLNITIRGEPRVVPARIGLGSGAWYDHSLDEYGLPGAAPLHTHGATGVIHIESTVVRDYTLADFFAIWGQPLGPDRLLDAGVAPGEEIVIVADGAEGSLDPGPVFQDGMDLHLILRAIEVPSGG